MSHVRLQETEFPRPKHDMEEEEDELTIISEASEDPIILDVGGTLFKTSRATLTSESKYFASRLSGRWSLPKSPETGSIFIDADPDIFRLILRFMRNGAKPIFWTRSEGFDQARYAALLHEAEFFQVQDLVAWISDQEYLGTITESITTKVTEEVYHGQQLTAQTASAISGSNYEIYPAWTTERRYICPRGIDVHHGQPRSCGRACEKAKLEGHAACFRDVQILRTLHITKTMKLSSHLQGGEEQKRGE